MSFNPFRFDDEVYADWQQEVDKIAQTNLEKPLLVREIKDELDLVRVNFDPQVSHAMISINTHITVEHRHVYSCYTHTNRLMSTRTHIRHTHTL